MNIPSWTWDMPHPLPITWYRGGGRGIYTIFLLNVGANIHYIQITFIKPQLGFKFTWLFDVGIQIDLSKYQPRLRPWLMGFNWSTGLKSITFYMRHIFILQGLTIGLIECIRAVTIVTEIALENASIVGLSATKCITGNIRLETKSCRISCRKLTVKYDRT